MKQYGTGRQNGLTLMELMIVIALIGILSAVGWEQYRGQLQRGIRGDAVTALTQTAAQLEQCYSRVVPNSYASCTLENMGTGHCSDANLAVGNTIIYSPKCQWQLTIPQQDASSYSLEASRDVQAADGSTTTETLGLDNLGRKTGPWPQ